MLLHAFPSTEIPNKTLTPISGIAGQRGSSWCSFHKSWVQILCLPGFSERVLPVPCIFCCTSCTMYKCWSICQVCVCTPQVLTESLSLRWKAELLNAQKYWKKNEIIKQISWSIRHGTHCAGRSPVSVKVSHFFRSGSNSQIWWVLLISDGSSRKDAWFPRIPWDAPPKFSNLKKLLRSQFVPSVFKIKAKKRCTRAEAVISAPVRCIFFLMDPCLSINYVLTDSSFNRFVC